MIVLKGSSGTWVNLLGNCFSNTEGYSELSGERRMNVVEADMHVLNTSGHPRLNTYLDSYHCTSLK